MANTTNFNWETPDDTDLVKDGAAAMRTLGNSIDTSFVDLKGGTTGQVLSKASNTDLDYTWVTTDDANAIQNAIVDAKGDLIAATAADTPARLAVGANDLVLTAASGEATGLKYTGSVQSWTPTFTNFTFGNASLNYAQYVQVGKLVYFNLRVTLGSTSVMGTNPSFTLPIAVKSGAFTQNSNVFLLDSGTALYTGITEMTGTSAAFYPTVVNLTYATQGAITATTPFTWTTSDRFYVSGTYEVD
jgi:hypothetical protein